MSPPVSADSIRARLITLARERGQQAELLLTRYAIERLLYRLSLSAHRARFVLKGALLFDLWFHQSQRPTRDADLLGHGEHDPDAVAAVFREIVAIPIDDGIVFDPASLTAIDIRQQARYPGVRVTVIARLAGARLTVQVDVGFGDVIAEPVDEALYPGLLPDIPAPHLQVYPKESVLAEKLHILTTLGIANSRLKDYYDLWLLGERADFEFAVTAQAVAATFARRATTLPERLPVGLSDAFGQDASKQAQWRGFLNRTGLDAPALPDVVARLAEFLGPLVLADADRSAPAQWRAGGSWAPSLPPETNAAESVQSSETGTGP